MATPFPIRYKDIGMLAMTFYLSLRAYTGIQASFICHYEPGRIPFHGSLRRNLHFSQTTDILNNHPVYQMRVNAGWVSILLTEA